MKNNKLFFSIFTAIIMLFGISLFNIEAYGETNNTNNAIPSSSLGGILSQDTVLTKDKSPYIIYSDLTIVKGVSLTINEGVVIKLAPNTWINVEGNIFVNGSSTSHVVFTNLEETKWGKLLINSNNNVVKYLDIINGREGIEVIKDENTIYNIDMKNCEYDLNFKLDDLYDFSPDYFSLMDMLKAGVSSISDYDLNHDNKVDILDITLVANLYNTKSNNPGYNIAMDLNKDNIINLYDMVIISKHIGADEFKLAGYKVFIDPGHGGTDPGAVQNGYLEKVINLSLANKLKNQLLKYGATVTMSRESDITLDLKQRVALANSSGADLLISIHHNSFTSSTPTGMSTHYSTYRPAIETSNAYVTYNGSNFPYISENDGYITFNYYGNSKTLSYNAANITVYDPTPCSAAVLSRDLSKTMVDSLAALGFKNEGSRDHNLYLTRWPNMASILVEAGYISNAAEANKVTSPEMEEKMAIEMTKAIIGSRP